nr:MAG TPA: DNA-directed RNA polymerase subunit alpha [Caudoviricetes sp.]
MHFPGASLCGAESGAFLVAAGGFAGRQGGSPRNVGVRYPDGRWYRTVHQRAIKSRPRCYSTGDGKRYKKSLPFTVYQMEKGKSMDVFDSMEPWRQAEQLAADADSREAVLPKCARCGYPITGSKLVYIPAHDEFYCLNCIDSMTEFNEEAEVEE